MSRLPLLLFFEKMGESLFRHATQKCEDETAPEIPRERITRSRSASDSRVWTRGHAVACRQWLAEDHVLGRRPRQTGAFVRSCPTGFGFRRSCGAGVVVGRPFPRHPETGLGMGCRRANASVGSQSSYLVRRQHSFLIGLPRVGCF